jgi:hypothetical protein
LREEFGGIGEKTQLILTTILPPVIFKNRINMKARMVLYMRASFFNLQSQQFGADRSQHF